MRYLLPENVDRRFGAVLLGKEYDVFSKRFSLPESSVPEDSTWKWQKKETIVQIIA